MPKLKPPSYLRNGAHLARTIIRWPGGRIENKSLGAYGSPESYAAHARAVADWTIAWERHAAAEAWAPAGRMLTVDDLLARYLVAQQ
jgi:hypothetical protein